MLGAAFIANGRTWAMLVTVALIGSSIFRLGCDVCGFVAATGRESLRLRLPQNTVLQVFFLILLTPSVIAVNATVSSLLPLVMMCESGQ